MTTITFETVVFNSRTCRLSRMDRRGNPTGDVVAVVTSRADFDRRPPGVEAVRTSTGSLTEVVVDAIDLTHDLVARVLAAITDCEVELLQPAA